MKRWISLLLSLMLALGACVPGFAEELDFPTSWDVTTLYASVEDWEADYAKAESMVAEYDKFYGTLNTPENILAYYTWRYECELTALAAKLETYTIMSMTLNTKDEKAKELDKKFRELEDKIELKQDDLWEEMYALPMEERKELLSSPVLGGLSYYLRELLEEPNPYDNEEARAASEDFEDALGRAKGTYSALMEAIPHPMITMPDGTEVELTSDKYSEICRSAEYSHEFKLECMEARYKRLEPYLEVCAALLTTDLLNDAAEAKLDGYATVCEEATDALDVEPEFFDMVLEAAHKGQPVIHRYYAAYRDALGLEELSYADLSTKPTDYEAVDPPFEEALAQTRGGMSVLGEEYIARLDGLLAAGHLDVYPGENKRNIYNTIYDSRILGPYTIMNYEPYYHASTVGAGLGVLVHLSYAMEGVENLMWEPNHLPLRVSDAVARLLVMRYEVDNAATDAERIYLLRQMLNLLRSDIYDNMRHMELVHEAFQIVDAGGELDVDTLSALNMRLLEEYQGEAMTYAPSDRYGWANRTSHYDGYDDLEVTAATLYAAAICQAILSGEDGAADRYIAMMSAGGSASPVDLLAIAGADPRDPQTYEDAFAFISGLVDEFEELTK